MKLNGSEIVVECLKEQGVDTVFGYPGGSDLKYIRCTYINMVHEITSYPDLP